MTPLFISLIGLIGVASSICSFIASNTCYVDLPGVQSLENEIICASSTMYQQCVVSCNEPWTCSNEVIEFHGDECIVNCNTDASCNGIKIITYNCKYTQLNLKGNVDDIYIQIKSDHDMVLSINDEMINQNDCNAFLVGFDIKTNEINIDCEEYPYKRSLMPYSTLSTENIMHFNEFEAVRMSEEKDLMRYAVTLLSLIVLLICSICLLIIGLCWYFKKEERYEYNDNDDNNNEDDSSSNTETFDGVTELAGIEHETYLNMMNEMLSVKSISVIST